MESAKLQGKQSLNFSFFNVPITIFQHQIIAMIYHKHSTYLDEKSNAHLCRLELLERFILKKITKPLPEIHVFSSVMKKGKQNTYTVVVNVEICLLFSDFVKYIVQQVYLFIYLIVSVCFFRYKINLWGYVEIKCNLVETGK